MKKFLAILLSLIMLLSILPSFAFAGETDPAEEVVVSEPEETPEKTEPEEELVNEPAEEPTETEPPAEEAAETPEPAPFDVEAAFRKLADLGEEEGREFILSLSEEDSAALKNYISGYEGEDLSDERSEELLSWFEAEAESEEEEPAKEAEEPAKEAEEPAEKAEEPVKETEEPAEKAEEPVKEAKAGKVKEGAAFEAGPSFVDYKGSISTPYGNIKYETGKRDLTFRIYVNGTLVSTYYIGDMQLTANTTSFTVASGADYRIHDAKVTGGTWDKVGSTDTVRKGTLTLWLGSDPWAIDLYLSAPHTVTVNYVYPDKSENNPDITTLTSYTAKVYHGEEFKSNEWNYYDAADARNAYTGSVKNETTGKSVDTSGTAWGGYYFRDTINADTTYTVTLNPTNKEQLLAVDAYLYRGGNAIGFDDYMGTTFKYYGYTVSDENGNDQVYVLKDGALQSAASINSLGDPTIIVKNNIQYKYYFSGLGLNLAHIKDLYYDSSDQNWYYVYRWVTDLELIDVSWTNTVGPIVIPFTEAGRINFVYKEYASDHKLIYDANGGTNAPATQTKNTSQYVWNFTVSSAEPTRDGYVFLGWADTADATTPTYHGGSTIGVTGTKTIYAVWKQQAEIDEHVTLIPVDVIKPYDSKTYTAGTATAVDDAGNTVVIEYSVDGTNWVTDPATITATNVADSKVISVRASVPGVYQGYVTGTQQLTIQPREVTVTGDGWTGDQPYTGSEYKKTTYSFSNVLDGQTATITYNISGKDIGSYTGVFGDDFKVIAGSSDVTANYSLTTKTPGTLVISAPSTKDLTYHVKYVVDSESGTVLKTTDKTVEIPSDASTYSVTSVDSETFTGYKVKTNPTLPADVEDGDVLFVIYEKDASQTKELHYAVKYVIDSTSGAELCDPVEKTVDIWVNDSTYEVTEVEEKSFTGYKLKSTDPELPAEVSENGVVYVIYVKDGSQTKKLNYSVKYITDDDAVLKTTDKTVDIWVNDTTYEVTSVDPETFTGYKVKTNPTLPATVEDGDVLYVIYEKDASQTKKLNYSVKYVVDSESGTVLKSTDKSVDIWVNDTTYEVTSVDPETFTGYKVKTNPTLPATVEDGDVLYVIYEKDASQTKKLNYSVKYVVDSESGTVLKSTDKSVDIWVNDTTYEVTSVDPETFTGYKVKTNPTLPATVEDGDVLYVIYEKDESQTKKLSYTVNYVVGSEPRANVRKALFAAGDGNGTILYSDVRTVDVWVNDTTYEVTSIESRTFPGYVLKSTPKLPATVSEGDVLYVLYEKDASQTKKLNYSVKYVVDSESGTVLKSTDKTVDIWVNDTTYEVTSVPSETFTGYKVKTNPVLPATVEDGDVLYVIYEKDASQTKKLNYTVKYVVGSQSGPVLFADDKSVSIWVNDTTYEVTSIDPKTFVGYVLKSTPVLPVTVSEGDVLYVIYDAYYGNLTISKSVAGDLADRSKTFYFKVELDVDGTFEYVGSVSGKVSNGGVIALRHGERITITGIPAGAHYTVTETENSGYKVYATGNVGVIVPNETVRASFTNTRSSVPSTGDERDSGLWMGLMGVSFLGMAISALPDGKKRKKAAHLKNK